MKKISLLLLALGISSLAFGKTNPQEYQLLDLNFAAPTVYGDPAVSNSQVGSIIYDLSTHSFRGLYDGGAWASIGQTAASTAPTIQKFTSGSGTYTTPAGVLYIRVRMVGGGGGGAGSGTTSIGAGVDGTATTFGTSLLVANGGLRGSGGGSPVGGAGGSASLGTGPIGINISGGSGNGSNYSNTALTHYAAGGMGGSSALGGAAGGAGFGNTGIPAAVNSGSGGGGAGSGTTAASYAGPGGGAGGYVDAIISSPTSTYSYVVGTGGAGGSAGASGTAGGAGGSGLIEVTEYYQ